MSSASPASCLRAVTDCIEAVALTTAFLWLPVRVEE
jgi:hypothetical protein